MNQIDKYIAREIAGLNFECAPSCSWCCQQLVVLTNIEDGKAIVKLAKSRMSNKEYRHFKQLVKTQAEEIGSLSYEEAETRQWPCPLLVDNQCIVYEARPIACRSVFSSDKTCCKAMLEAENYDDLSDAHQKLADEIGERAMKLQFSINDSRTIDGAFELRELLAKLLD